MKVDATEKRSFILIIVTWKSGGRDVCRLGNKSNKPSISNYIWQYGNRMLLNGETYRGLIICQNYRF
jgi:hypothetical protein